MPRWLTLGAGLVLVGAVGAPACQLPDTLGLACERHDHCNAGQHCGPDDTCIPGPPPMMMPTTGEPPDSTGGGSTGGGSDGGPLTSTSAADTTDGGGASTGGTEATTGPACGRAIGACDAVDLLLVVDNSGSMEDDNARLIPAFANVEDLVAGFVDGPCSYRIGITTTEPAPDFQPPECQQRGALSRAGALCSDPWPGQPDHPPWVDENDSINSLGCLIAVGTDYATDEKQVQTVLESIGPALQGPGGCNEGFMREGVPLVVVFVTDEDDDDDSTDPFESPERTGTPGDPSDWFDELTALKPASELGVVLVVATGAGRCAPWQPSSGQSDGIGAETADRLVTLTQHFTAAGYSDHVRVVELCQPGEELVAEVMGLGSVLDDVCADVGG